MKTKKDIGDRKPAPIKIQPVSFRPGHNKKRLTSSRMLKWIFGLTIGIFLILLCTSAWFVFTARQVVIQIDPQPDRIDIHGGLPAPRIGDYYLMRSGDYVLEAGKKCYQPFQQKFVVASEKSQIFKFSLTKQPGKLSFPGSLILKAEEGES